MRTEIQVKSVVIDGVTKLTYRALVTSFSLSNKYFLFRHPAIRMLEDLDENVNWMSQNEFNEYVDNLEIGSLERAMKVVDLLIEAKQKHDDKLDKIKQAKRTKKISYCRYP